ncbi:kinase-like protein [Rhizophagus irregularis]|uniref:Kinase-like protein n=1 Tax=Rhizophagus irregularis TaxID=588596 RepID=A0A2N0PZB1_9GLOM|nr:kinase-like protein [Rhizophagus irregularis]
MDSFGLIEPSDANEICKKCNHICYAMRFQQNFKNWTSGNNNIDKFIQDTQLSEHTTTWVLYNALEWIPYDRLFNTKYIAKDEFGKVYRANWCDGIIYRWDNKNRNWERGRYNMFVNLKSLNTPNILTLEFVSKIKIEYRFYGITQDPETKNYMMVLNNKCKKCNNACYSIHFQHKFIDWTSGNDDIDKLIRDTQLSTHEDVMKALEWVPYDRLHNVKYIANCKVLYSANWIDGNIFYNLNWDNENQNWKREKCNMFVNLKSLNTPNNLTLEFVNKIKTEHEFYGMTQDPETKIYMMVVNNKCEKCNSVCNSIHFQQNFEYWTSGNNNIDKLIQDTQLSAHSKVEKVLEWIPYDRLYNIKYIAKDEFGKIYRANWIDGYILSYKSWDNKNQNWTREGCNMFVNLKSLNTSNILTLEFVNKINIEHEFYGITWDQEIKNYMMVLNNKCIECNKICNSIYFQRNFENWTSGNDDIDKFIQDIQLSAHKDVKNALEWIPYDRFYDIEYIAKGGFGKVYRANLTYGFITDWDSKNQNWKRNGKDILIALKSLDNSKNIASEFINEIIMHNKVGMENFVIVGFYGITQDPETKNYMMVLDYAKDGSLRNYLDKEYSKLNWNKKFDYLRHIITGLEYIHEQELVHRDLHIGNILKFKYKTVITDMGLCKPANYNALENAENNIYGVLPYIAPEILRRQNYTKAADIYSFAIKICNGFRPRFNIKVPQLIVHLIKRCLDANPLNRPIAKEINNILRRWQNESNDKQTVELQAQIKEADEIYNNYNNSLNNTASNLGISYNTHSEAIYTSRLLDFNNLPEPKNSDDYYEQNDDIISKEYSESLQFNFSQLNINKSESCQIDISQLNINENESCQINISQLNINDNESCQINISQLNINENESSQINVSRLNDNGDSQNSKSGSKRKNYFLSQNNESESERKKNRIE